MFWLLSVVVGTASGIFVGWGAERLRIATILRSMLAAYVSVVVASVGMTCVARA